MICTGKRSSTSTLSSICATVTIDGDEGVIREKVAVKHPVKRRRRSSFGQAIERDAASFFNSRVLRRSYDCDRFRQLEISGRANARARSV